MPAAASGLRAGSDAGRGRPARVASRRCAPGGCGNGAGNRPVEDTAMRTELFDYFLPPEAIAQHPLPNRGAARMMVLQRSAKTSEDSSFRRLPEYLRRGDLLVINNSRVIKARLRGVREKTGGKIEVLLVRPWPEAAERGADGGEKAGTAAASEDGGASGRGKDRLRRDAAAGNAAPDGHDAAGESACEFRDGASPRGNPPGNNMWIVLARSGGKLTVGERLILGGGALSARLLRRMGNEGDLVEFDRGGRDFEDAIERIGEVPLPPYIRRPPAPEDAERYQTVYAASPGSVAAPTAGLHFSSEMLEAVEAAGVRRAELTLHVGPGTFQPVKHREVEDHRIGKEAYAAGEDTVRAVLETKAAGGRVVAVGTTTLRVLETLARTGALNQGAKPTRAEGMTDLFVYPPFDFKAADALLTNFHLPKSTLLMLVCAFASPGRTDGIEWILDRYEHAKKSGYRFYSYGDCMLIL